MNSATRWRAAQDGGARGRDAEGQDQGSSLLEVIVLTTVLLVPLASLVTAVGTVQAASFAATTAAREAARVYVASDSDSLGRRRAAAAVSLAVTDQGFAAPRANALTLSCHHGRCLAPASTARATVTLRVRLPGLPAILGDDRGVIPVTATAEFPVDEFRGAP